MASSASSLPTRSGLLPFLKLSMDSTWALASDAMTSMTSSSLNVFFFATSLFMTEALTCLMQFILTSSLAFIASFRSLLSFSRNVILYPSFHFFSFFARGPHLLFFSHGRRFVKFPFFHFLQNSRVLDFFLKTIHSVVQGLIFLDNNLGHLVNHPSFCL